MTCPRCQHENAPAVKFCGECGARLEVVCSACRAANPPRNKFCNECGAPISPGAAAGSPTSPESYTPKHLAEKILISKAALEGERKQVTVLFADLKGSMELLADRDPEEARKILDPVLERMMEAVHRYEGTVNQVMGDGIMALFGAPVAHEDHAVRACYAALRMQAEVARHGADVLRTLGVPVEVRIGVHSGAVVVRAVGSDLRMDYTAVGQTTHLAARMEQIARPGATFVTAETLRLAEGYVHARPIGPVAVKGLAAPVDVFELTGAAPGRTRLQAAAARGLTRFVGRDAEMEQLRQAVDRARAGHGQVFAVVGEPGVGKSRLAWEFTHSYRSQDWLVLEATSVSYGKAATYFPVIDLLRRYFHVEARDDSRRIREKVTGKLLALDRALEAASPAFLTLLEVPVDDAPWAALDPSERRHRTLDALKRLLVRESQVQPVLAVFEDLHWIDGETQALLDLLVESIPTARLLLLVNYRPEYTHAWGSKTYYQQLRLDPLPTPNARELLEALVGTDRALADLQRLLIERTHGNPFFLEETVQGLVEVGTLTGERGAYQITGPVDNIRMPPTVQAILAARIDRLAPEDKRLLQAAAVIGKDVPYPVLLAVADETEESVRGNVGRLQAAEFLYEAQLFPELEYTFKHALTHEVAYSTVLRERRRELHGHVVDAIERLHEGRLADHFEPLAHHAERAERWTVAMKYLDAVGRRAADRNAYTQAIDTLRRALDIGERLEADRPTLERIVDIHLAIRGPLFASGRLDELTRTAKRAETLAHALGDEQRLGWARAQLLNAFVSLAQSSDAREYVALATESARSTNEPGLRAYVSLQVSAAAYGSGQFQASADEAVNALERLRDKSERREFGASGYPKILLKGRACVALACLGRFEEAFAYGHDGLAVARTVGSHFGEAFVGLYLSFALNVCGRFQDGLLISEQALHLVEQSGVALLLPTALANAAHARAMVGRIFDAVPLAERAEETPTVLVYGHTAALLQAAQVRLAAGLVEDARDRISRVLATARSLGERGVEADALHALGDVLTALPDASARAVESYEAARKLAEELQMRPLVAHCQLGLGKVARRTGQREQALEHVTTATTMYREMGMTYWLEQAEETLRGLA